MGIVLPFLIITPQSRGLSIGAIGAVFAVHSAVAIVLGVARWRPRRERARRERWPAASWG